MNASQYSTRFSVTDLKLSLKSRIMIFLVRWLLRTLLAFSFSGPLRRITKAQFFFAGLGANTMHQKVFDYAYHGEGRQPVAGHVLGKPFAGTGEPVVLWLHGGAFALPTTPDVHLRFTRRLCGSLAASAFVPDYRLAPANPFPAAIDDCEAAYRLLLDSGVPPESIIVGGESAGGNLLVSLLYRIRKHGLPMPGCAVAVSPALDLCRLHGSPSRAANVGREAMLPIISLANAMEWYLGEADATHPEVSPLFGDCSGLPPMMIVASEAEFLCDDSVLFASRLAASGITTELAIWPHLPHAFPLLEHWFPEASRAREQIEAFIQEHVIFKNT